MSSYTKVLNVRLLLYFTDGKDGKKVENPFVYGKFRKSLFPEHTIFKM